MKFVAIADTHGQHEALLLPVGDVLIHAGDMSMRGSPQEILNFVSWFEAQPFEFKIFIAGNHDFYFERESKKQIEKIIPSNIIYLDDSGTTINDFKIWGSPITPWFYNWAFNRYPGSEIKIHWDLIPTGTDILITHGPVYKTLDKTNRGDYAGCRDLLAKVQEVKPPIHICGHIHEAYGTENKESTKFINASVVNERYQLVNPPIVFEL